MPPLLGTLSRYNGSRVVFVVANLGLAVWGMTKPSMRGRWTSMRVWLPGMRKSNSSTKSKSPVSRKGMSLPHLSAAPPCVISLQVRDRAMSGGWPNESFDPSEVIGNAGRGRRPRWPESFPPRACGCRCRKRSRRPVPFARRAEKLSCGVPPRSAARFGTLPRKAGSAPDERKSPARHNDPRVEIFQSSMAALIPRPGFRKMTPR